MIKTARKNSPRETPSSPAETPLMKQYNSIKSRYPDALLLFRVGDFYETFGEDAVRAAAVLGITLTKRKNGAAAYVELAGFPHHSLDTYLPRLVKAGNRVAICDQLEDPKLAKGIVKRGITELVTPGVSYHDKTLEPASNNFLAAVVWFPEGAGIAFLDISTGEFLCAQGTSSYIDKLMQGFQPAEVLYARKDSQRFQEQFADRYYTQRLDDWIFHPDTGTDILLRQFATRSLKGYGVEDWPMAITAAGAVLHYLADTQHDKVQHIRALGRIEEDHFVWMDKFTVRNLELVQPNADGAVTLLSVLDRTVTPMGSRLLRRWMVLPLKDLHAIRQRLSVVDWLHRHDAPASQLSTELKNIGDLERLISKVSTGRINPREVYQLKRALESVTPVKHLCADSGNDELVTIAHQLNDCKVLYERIATELHPEPPVAVQKGGIIAPGIHPELDELRALAHSGKDYLVDLQRRESERTGIPSLRVAYNNVFGYYLEVRHTHKDKVPADWIRKQTLVQAERYITPELKEYETKILGAEERILALETQLFTELVAAIAEFTEAIQLNARLLAKLDVLLSFATLAHDRGYVKPSVNEGNILQIIGGRHPVIEQQLVVGQEYVPNDIYLDPDTQQIVMITGPNMSGKSAVLRQTALITLMAQMGSFVPAASADIGLVDKIFTRVGASDNLSTGDSTFMVEMNETASILNNLSDRSLVLLDEIGRGTSTYDGISIAWAIAEFIHEHPRAKAKTLFATHYHELNEMEAVFTRIHNFNVSVKESGNKVIFLRKLVPGGSNHSFGIHVARMAGMPVKVVERAREILVQLEKSHRSEQLSGQIREVASQAGMQLSFFQLDDPTLAQVREQITHLDINTLTPVEALLRLSEIKRILEGKS